MTKLIALLLALQLLAQSLPAQHYTGFLKGYTATLHFDSVGQNAWQGYFTYDDKYFPAVAIRVDSQTTVAFIQNNEFYSPYSYSFTADFSRDTLIVTEETADGFKSEPADFMPYLIKMTRSKQLAPPTALIAAYKKATIVPDASGINAQVNRLPIIGSFRDPAVTGIWEWESPGATGHFFVSLHADGTLFRILKTGIRHTKGLHALQVKNEGDISYLLMDCASWCIDQGIIYTKLGDKMASKFGTGNPYELTAGSMKLTRM